MWLQGESPSRSSESLAMVGKPRGEVSLFWVAGGFLLNPVTFSETFGETAVIYDYL
jgi:hypothetical protein